MARSQASWPTSAARYVAALACGPHALPMARAMIAKSVGDQIEVDAPGGARYYETAKIDYA